MGGKRPFEGDKRFFHIACILMIVAITGNGCRSATLEPIRSALFEKKTDSHLKKAETYIREGEFDAALLQNDQCSYQLQHEALLQKGLIYAHPASPFRDNGKARECFENLITDMVQADSDIYNRAVVFRSLIDDLVKSETGHQETYRALRKKNKEVVEAMHGEMMGLRSKIAGLEAEIFALRKQLKNMKQVDLNLEEKKLNPITP